ncbi:tetratricopeptide repeat protein [candidate division KSB1 bacterium]|nr:protein kinase [candidate division KSB1 bacterium]RQW04384.1 MAG: tetratricopeptide repeat protein [candidate division KSB1 bacterium]
MIGQIISHYQIIEELGRGGMGIVYKAQDTRLFRPVALKFLPSELTQDEEANQRFFHEAQTASQLDHQNISTIYEIDETADSRIFICMAYYAGETLKDKIADGPLSVADALNISIQIARGLAKAHEKGIIHRDIKPGNIIVQKDGTVKIIDFGLSKLINQQGLTKTNTTKGTAAYMSPEQALGKEVNGQADIWALGVVLYHMLTGEMPFRGENDPVILYSIVHEAPSSLLRLRPDVPKPLAQIITKAMSKEQSDRYASMNDMLKDLLLCQQNISQHPATSRLIAGKKRRKISTKYVVYAFAFTTIVVLTLAIFQILPLKNVTIDSIAVLPLDYISDDLEKSYYADEMTEGLIKNLAKIKALRVISRTSVMAYKDNPKPVPEIADELNVKAIIEGSVNYLENRLRVTVKLIDAKDDRHVWANSYNRKVSDIYILQGEITRAIAKEIQVELNPLVRTNLENMRPVNPEAYELLRMAQEFFRRRTSEAYAKAIEYMQAAFEKDPNYAYAYASLANSYIYMANWNLMPPHEAAEKAKQLAYKALEIDSLLYEAHGVMGYIKMVYDWDWEGAAKFHYRRKELYPNDSWNYFNSAWMLAARFRRFDEAFREMERCIELNPTGHYGQYGWLLYTAGRYDRAIEKLQKAIQIDPTGYSVHQTLGQTFLEEKMYERAIEEIKKAIDLCPEGSLVVTPRAALAHAYAVSGKRQEAEKILTELLDLKKQQYVSYYDLAVIHTGLGQHDLAFEKLENAVECRDGWLAGHLNIDPRFEPVRSDARFSAILKQIGIE